MQEREPTARERLVETAARLFEMQGYYATGLNQILKDSRAPKGSLYYYFPEGKEELACEAIACTAARVGNRIRRDLTEHADPVRAIQSIILHLAQDFQSTDCLGGVHVVAVALETSPVSNRIREACRHAYDLWIGLFAEKLEAGGYSFERANVLSTTINSMVEGAMILSRTRKNSEALIAVADVIPVLLSQRENVQSIRYGDEFHEK